MSEHDETALTLQQAAERMQLPFSTVFSMRKQIGFRLPGSRLWRVWPSRLAGLTEKRNNLTRLSLRVGVEIGCQSADVKAPGSGLLTSARQAAKEFAALLKQRTGGQRRNTTTG
ncbi:DNA-binding protein [Burkholderia ubonensis]|uniref:DNA-binding protein n=1 Tax=Burkholderia ubonensis TaxID=101571 RepID=UPI000A7B21B7|nr:DNA-binding protein [Burkholderia ubonensis]